MHLDLDMGTVIVLIGLMVAAYSLRAYLYIRQTNAVLDVLRTVKNTWPNHALGRGSHMGKKAIVILGADEELVVQEAFVLQGVTVFARARSCQALVGNTVATLAGEVSHEPPKGLGQAAWKATGVASEFIMTHLRAPEDEEYDRDLMEE